MFNLVWKYYLIILLFGGVFEVNIIVLNIEILLKWSFIVCFRGLNKIEK